MKKLLKINPGWFIATYVVLNLYKPIVGILLGREIITAISLFITISMFILFLSKDVMLGKIKKTKVVSFSLIILFTIHLIISLTILAGADLYPTLVSYFQLTTPMYLLFLLESLDHNVIRKLARFLVISLVPFIFFGFVEFLLPTEWRIKIYLGFSKFVTGEGVIDVAYYLGDTELGVLRLGSLFFEPLTFAFVSSFLTIYLFARKRKEGFVTLIINLLSLGKLPIIITFISVTSIFFNKLNRLYFLFLIIIISGGIIYFIENAQTIAIENPSMGSHMLGLGYGLINGLKAPFFGHGLGTAGYMSYVYYLKTGNEGPFVEGIGGLMNGNESTVGVVAYQMGYILLIAFLGFFIAYFFRLVGAKQIMMASAVLGFILSLFLSESVLSITVISVLLIFSKALISAYEDQLSHHN